MKKIITKLMMILLVGLFMIGAMSCAIYTCPTYAKVEVTTCEKF